VVGDNCNSLFRFGIKQDGLPMEKASRGKSPNDLDVTGKIVQSSMDQKKTALSDAHFQTVAFLAKSLSDENRLRIILCVSCGKKSVTSIVEALGLSQPLVSHHLRELKRSLLVKIERNGPFIYYELVDHRILDVLRTLSIVATDLITARKTF
jgi:ArsR family transcriptional regulator, zinc-responsive transcriptional repressor